MNRINPYLVAGIVGGVVSLVIGTLGWRWIPNGFLFLLSGSLAGIASVILASRLTRTVESPKPTAPETPKPTAPKRTAPKTPKPKTPKPKSAPKTPAPKPTGTP